MIAHSSTRIEKTADNGDIEIIGPDLPKRGAEICNGIVDIIGYIGNEYKDGFNQRWLYTRETPTLFAGSRFKYLKPKIKFGYQELVDAISEAIDQTEKEDGITVVDHLEVKTEEKLNFIEVRQEAADLWSKLILLNEDNAVTILKKIEIVMGRKMKLSEFTEDQTDLLAIVVEDMKEMLK